MFFDNRDEGLWAESQTPSEFKSKSDKKGKARKYWKCESLKKHACLSVHNNFHTSGKQWERKYAYSLLQLS